MKKLLKIPLAIGGAASALTLAIDKAYRYNLHKRKCLFLDLAEVDKDKFHWEFMMIPASGNAIQNNLKHNRNNHVSEQVTGKRRGSN